MKRMARLTYVLLGALALLLVSQSGALAAGRPGDPGSEMRKIVVFSADVTNLPAQAAMVRAAGGQVIKPLPLVNGMATTLPPAAQAALLRHAGVLRVDNDIEISASGKPSWAGGPGGGGGGGSTSQDTLVWGVDRIDAEWVWGGGEGATNDTTGLDGEFVKVGVLDTGIDLTHPDLSVRGNVNFVNPRKDGNDDNGHGSHVSGIIAALDNNQGVIGVAPKAYLYAVKVLDAHGSGWLSDLVSGLQWCIDNHMQVVNMSLGASSDNQTFHDAITATYNAGVIMVAAAGNSGTLGLDYPGRYPETIAVSATNSDDSLASYSSYGPQVDLAAPGTSIYSTYKKGGYATLSGTSMATPHVTGTVALVLGKSGTMTPDAMKSFLKNTAENIGLTASQEGGGLVDAQYAVDMAP